MTRRAVQKKRAAALAEIPPRYSPWLHLAGPTGTGIAILAASLLLLSNVTALQLLTLPITMFGLFGAEWIAHRYILHERMPFAAVLYERHELLHHVIYTNEDMTLRDRREWKLVLMPAYAVALVGLILAPIVAVLALATSWNVALLVLATTVSFVVIYEWLHLSYHLPADSRIGRSSLIRRLREVHRRHHDPRLMKRFNFNVTVPVFDRILGTLWTAETEEKARTRRRVPASSKATAKAAFRPNHAA